ncbi:MAG: type II toxin-antitoxin system HicA family toxin [Candidatus Bathyarchaeia archaeon]|jgi:predicted RNA binding protein YcfA (HicA-like mRNA interferase family)
MSLKPQPAKKIIKVLSKLGFEVVRKRGSHVILKHADGRLTVVPVHAGEEIGSGLLNKIIKDTGLSKEEFIKLLETA